MNFKNYILKHSIPHVCNAGVTCSGNHESGLYEFPSVIFIKATIKARELYPDEQFSPDWQYHWLSWCKIWRFESDFIDLGYLGYKSFPVITQEICLNDPQSDLDDDDETGTMQTTIIKIKG